MKCLRVLLLLVVLLSPFVWGCGVSQSDYDNLQIECAQTREDYDSLLAEKEKLQTEFDKLKEEHDTLIADTTDWLQLTKDQKAAELAKAETEMIAAEKAAKKAREEKAAAEAKEKAEAERKAAEEAKKRAEEEKKGYKTGITYDQLARNPEEYRGKKVMFKGEVLQVSEVDSEIQIRLATKANKWGGYSDNVIYVYFDKSLLSGRILEDDIITIYGIARGLHTYTTVLGASVTLPLIEVEKIDN